MRDLRVEFSGGIEYDINDSNDINDSQYDINSQQQVPTGQQQVPTPCGKLGVDAQPPSGGVY
jgi:hypothetical protein